MHITRLIFNHSLRRLVHAKKRAASNGDILYQTPNNTGQGRQGNGLLRNFAMSGDQVKVYVDNGGYSKKSGNFPSLHSLKTYQVSPKFLTGLRSICDLVNLITDDAIFQSGYV